MTPPLELFYLLRFGTLCSSCITRVTVASLPTIRLNPRLRSSSDGQVMAVTHTVPTLCHNGVNLLWEVTQNYSIIFPPRPRFWRSSGCFCFPRCWWIWPSLGSFFSPSQPSQAFQIGSSKAPLVKKAAWACLRNLRSTIHCRGLLKSQFPGLIVLEWAHWRWSVL